MIVGSYPIIVTMSDDGWGELFAMAAGEEPELPVAPQLHERAHQSQKRKRKRKRKKDSGYHDMLAARMNLPDPIAPASLPSWAFLGSNLVRDVDCQGWDEAVKLNDTCRHCRKSSLHHQLVLRNDTKKSVRSNRGLFPCFALFVIFVALLLPSPWANLHACHKLLEMRLIVLRR